MRRQLNRKINRIDKKLSATARRPEVIFLLPGEDIDESKRQRYRDIPDDSEILTVTFRGAVDASVATWHLWRSLDPTPVAY
jgi:hypothetical protein